MLLSLAVWTMTNLIGQPLPNQSSDTFTQALLAEEREQDLEKAANLYGEIVEHYDSKREQAANAILRCAECMTKLGKEKEAKTLYGRILRECIDFPELVQLSQARLATLQKKSVPDKDLFTITLSAVAPLIRFEEKSVDRNDLEALLTKVIQNYPDAQIRIDADVKTPMDKVTPVVHLTEKLGFKTVLVSADPLTRKAEEFANIRIKILGQVANPGIYEVPPGMEIDLLDAIALAGGYTRIAGKVTINYNEKGEQKTESFRLKDLTKGSVNGTLPKLTGNVTIIVGESIF